MRPITASDLMNPEVLTVRGDMSVRDLAAFLVDNEITGAPVEDEDGKLVGVVSLIDIVEIAAGDEPAARARESANPDFYVRDWEDQLSEEDMETLHIEEEDIFVREIMTPQIFSVEEDARVAEVARMMLDGHIHRVLVTRDDKPVGIISTSDLLGLLVEED